MSSSESDFSASFSSDSSNSISQEPLPDIGDIDLNEENVNFAYDEELEPVATEEETAAYDEQVEAEQRQQEELVKRFSQQLEIQSW